MDMWLCGDVAILKFVPLARWVDSLGFWRFLRVCNFQIIKILKNELRDHFGIILGPLWAQFGIILESFGDHVGTIFTPFGDHFGIILKPLWGHSGIIQG